MQMTGWRTVVYFNRIRHTASEYAAVVYKAVAADLIYYNFRYAMGAATSIVRQSSFAVVILFAAFLVARGRATVGDFVTLVTYWSGIWSPIVNLSSNMR